MSLAHEGIGADTIHKAITSAGVKVSTSSVKYALGAYRALDAVGLGARSGMYALTVRAIRRAGSIVTVVKTVADAAGELKGSEKAAAVQDALENVPARNATATREGAPNVETGATSAASVTTGKLDVPVDNESLMVDVIAAHTKAIATGRYAPTRAYADAVAKLAALVLDTPAAVPTVKSVRALVNA